MTRVPREKTSAGGMQALFGAIAPRYDFITRAFSFRMDSGWKKEAMRGASLAPRARVLDLACGTGDFARLAGARAVGCDLTSAMLHHARDSGVDRLVCADAMRLPFRDSIFDAVFVGYGLRNFPDLDGALVEIRRVLQPGGQLVSLDFFLPDNVVWRRLYLAYLWIQGVFWGTVLHLRPSVYTYIPRSLAGFLPARRFSDRLERAGWVGVRCRRFLGGGIAVHWAVSAPTTAALPPAAASRAARSG